MYLTIGTVQFGMKYGLRKKKIQTKEIIKIKKTIKNNNIIYLDTSINYGDSEKKIGLLNIGDKKIITKILLPKKKIKNLEIWYKNSIKESLKKLKVKSLYALLIHDTSNILGKNKKFLDLILDSKKKMISKIGISVYDVSEVNKILKFWTPDIIQFPANIFDQRFLERKFLQNIKRLKIEIYARSCFLQGVLLSKKLKIGNNRSHQIFESFLEWCKKNKTTQLISCLHFIKQIKYIDSLIVGFDDANQLNEIIYAFNQRTIAVPYKFINNEKKLIDPRKWRID
tara:strand:- start:273 stop:1121 length:849 start_codon:yes stop_codon:yes gene_type:complete